MEGNIFLLLCIGLPLFGSFLLPFLGRVTPRGRNVAAVAVCLAAFFFATVLSRMIPSGGVIDLYIFGGLGFHADALSCSVAMLISFIGSIVLFYSFGYAEQEANQNEYYMTTVLLVGAVIGLVFSPNLLQIYIFWLLAAVCVWRIACFFREEQTVLHADKTLLLLSAGAVLLLLGFVSAYLDAGSFALASLKEAEISGYSTLLILAGILVGLGAPPFQVWLKNSASSPSSGYVLISLSVCLCGLYLFIRFFTFGLFKAGTGLAAVFPYITLIGALVCAGIALKEHNLNRIITYTGIAQILVVLFALLTVDPNSVAGGLFSIFTYSFAIAGLLLCAGIIGKKTGVNDISRMGGLFSVMPVTGIAFLLCASSLAGLPPLGGFWGKCFIVSGMINSVPIWTLVTVLLITVLTFICLFRAFIMIFTGDPYCPQEKEGSWEMVMSVGLLGVISFLAGIFVNVPIDLVRDIVTLIGR